MKNKCHTSNLSFSHNVFLSYICLLHQNEALSDLGEKDKKYARGCLVNTDPGHIRFITTVRGAHGPLPY